MSLYCFDHVRTAEQRERMERLDAAGVCLFCPDGIAAHAAAEVVLRTGHWAVLPNAFPYEGARLHLLLIPREHAEDLLELSAPARADFWAALARVKQRYGLAHYGLGARNGDCRYTGATIAHVHAHVLVGDEASADSPPVRMRLSSRPARGR